MRAPLTLLATIAGLTISSASAHAHSMRSAYLEIDETEMGPMLVTWKTTVADPGTRPTFPADCTLHDGDVKKAYTESPAIRTVSVFQMSCKEPLLGRSISISGMGPFIGETMIDYNRLGGEHLSTIVTANKPTWTLPQRTSRLTVLCEYVVQGFWHILEGGDHVLFVLALLLLVRKTRSLLWTATWFTIAHSITLSLTALELVRIPSTAAEAAIALTLIFVALDISPGKDQARLGPRIAFVFGLVHGFGFAGALGELGLPDRAVPLALGAFNVGVELGQIALLTTGLLALRLCRRLRIENSSAYAGAYVVGALGVFWFVERVAGILAARQLPPSVF